MCKGPKRLPKPRQSAESHRKLLFIYITMCKDEIDSVVQRYLSIGPEGRRRAPRIGSERHELIMSGAAILQAILRVWPSGQLTVADRGLREGLLYSQMTAVGAIGRAQ